MKTITSPVERWPGEVVLASPLTLPMVAEIEEAMVSARGKKSNAARFTAFLPGVFACVLEWHLGGGFPERPTLDNFPVAPALDRNSLLAWLVSETIDLYNEAVTVPNE
jgi:hypothetical protein